MQQRKEFIRFLLFNDAFQPRNSVLFPVFFVNKTKNIKDFKLSGGHRYGVASHDSHHYISGIEGRNIFHFCNVLIERLNAHFFDFIDFKSVFFIENVMQDTLEPESGLSRFRQIFHRFRQFAGTGNANFIPVKVIVRQSVIDVVCSGKRCIFQAN